MFKYDHNPHTQIQFNQANVNESFVEAITIPRGQMFVGQLDSLQWEPRIYIVTNGDHVVDIGNGAFRSSKYLKVYGYKAIKSVKVEYTT